MEPLLPYLNKHASGNPLVHSDPAEGLKYCIVIPAYLETRLEESLVSLFNAELPSAPVEVIIIINWSEDESKENIQISHKIYDSCLVWIEKHLSEKIRFHAIEMGYIPRKKAGVGFARKIGMDEAIRRFQTARQADGVIISFDADTICDLNYLVAMEEHFRVYPDTDGCSVYFEHPLEGIDYPRKVYKAIIQYELHMRYYLHSLKYIGFPNAFYTVGSAFAVRANSYCRQGGMNTRQAGEDFYFLQKFFDLGNFSDLLKTRVCPSPRPSLRVPFGTGKAIDRILKTLESLTSYNPASFEILKDFFDRIPSFYEQVSKRGKPELSYLDPVMLKFLERSEFIEELNDIYINSGSFTAFTKRFYRYFNMFSILKFVKFAAGTYPDLPVYECALALMQKTGMKTLPAMSEIELLNEFRRIDKGTTGSR